MRNITLAEGEYYHLYNRGVDKRAVFTSPAEYNRFLAYLYLMNDIEAGRLTYDLTRFSIDEAKPRQSGRALVAIGAYCLMPNHFHLYVTPLAKDGISKFMQRIQTGYTMYFNQKHKRTGALFQGTFKAQHVEGDPYAKYLFSYIHLNPASLKNPNWKQSGIRNLKGMKDFLSNYPYASLREYLERRHIITEPKKFPGYFLNARELDDHIDFWLDAGKDLRGLALQKNL